MKSPRMIALMWVLVIAFTTWGMPRPDDDQLSVRDPDSFGEWFDAPAEVEPLYQTLPAEDAAPVRSWTLDSSAGRVTVEFVGGDGNVHRLYPRISGTLSLDTRNLDLTRGVLQGEFPGPTGDWPTRFRVQLLGSSIGTAPRRIGSNAVGPIRMRIAMNDRSVELDGEFVVTRVAEDRITVSSHQVDGIDLADLGLEAALPELANRFGATWVEDRPTVRIELVLEAS